MDNGLISMVVAENKNQPQQETQHGGKAGELALPQVLGLRQQLTENDIQHGAGGKAQGHAEQRGIHGAQRVAQHGPQDGGDAADSGHTDGGRGPGAAGEEGRRNGHALRQVVQPDDQSRKDTAAAGGLGGPGKGGTDGHAYRHVVESNGRRQYQSCSVESVVAAGAHLLAGIGMCLMLLMVVMMIVVVVVVIVVIVPAVAVAVVGLLVDPAVEKVGEKVAYQDPHHHGENRGVLRGVSDEVKTHHADHHPGGEAQQQTHGPLGRTVDGGGKTAPQGQPAHAGEGGDEENGQIFVHGNSPILKSQLISILQRRKKSIKSVLIHTKGRF